MRQEKFTEFCESFTRDHHEPIPWTIDFARTFGYSLVKFKKYLEDRTEVGDTLFYLEYKALYEALFGPYEDVPLHINSTVPGVSVIATWRLSL